ncbi:hypothetical protein D3C72_1523160 [compost metagenome]
MPYLPTVKATAPSTPSGASLMMKPIILNSVCEKVSIRLTSGLPGSPTSDSAQPNRIETSSTCSTSPLANAPNTVLGISLSRKSTVP